MLSILTVTIPFFAVIGCGYGAARLGIVGETGRSGLNSFVFYFALPVLLFSVMSDPALAQDFEWRFVLAYTLACFLLFSISLIIARFGLRLDIGQSSLHALSGIYGNTGYMGIPLIIVAFGPQASVPVVICLAIDLALMIPVAMLFLASSNDSAHGIGLIRIIGQTARSLIRNPLIIAILAGIGVSTTGLELPTLITRFTDLLGAAAAPCALFALGSSLYGQPMRGAMQEISMISVTKLLVHPMLVYVAMFNIFNINPIWGLAAVVASTMPVAATVYVLAQQYDTYVVRASTAILVTTALSIFTVSAVLSYLAASGLASGLGN